VDGRQVQHYDSGLVLGGSSFPAIDLEVSMNSMICHDTVFRLVANPVFLNEIAPYALYHSQYEEGCFGPCDCPVRTQPIIGRFGLLKLGVTNEGDAFAVLDVRWSRREASTPPATTASPIVGYGVYRTGAAGLDQRMILDLLEDGVGPTRFDGGHVPWDGDLRRIDLDLSADGFACYDRVYSIYAKRRAAANTMFQAISTEPVSPGVVPLP